MTSQYAPTQQLTVGTWSAVTIPSVAWQVGSVSRITDYCISFRSLRRLQLELNTGVAKRVSTQYCQCNSDRFIEGHTWTLYKILWNCENFQVFEIDNHRLKLCILTEKFKARCDGSTQCWATPATHARPTTQGQCFMFSEHDPSLWSTCSLRVRNDVTQQYKWCRQVFSFGQRRSSVFCCGPCWVVKKDTEGRLSQSNSRRQPARMWDWEQRNRTEESRLLEFWAHVSLDLKVSLWREDSACELKYLCVL
jgi:hypothetical protein